MYTLRTFERFYQLPGITAVNGRIISFPHYQGIEDIRPDPVLCNIHHAICSLVHMSGAAGALNMMFCDDDDELGAWIPSLGFSTEHDSSFLDDVDRKLTVAY